MQVADAAGALSSRPVKIGINNKLTAQVLSGLTEGEQVVVRKGIAEAGAPSGPPPPGT